MDSMRQIQELCVAQAKNQRILAHSGLGDSKLEFKVKMQKDQKKQISKEKQIVESKNKK